MSFVRSSRFYLFLLVAFTISAIEMAIVSSPIFRKLSDIASLAVTADIVVGIPVLFYFLIARKKRLSTITLFPVLLVAIILADFILPASNRAYLEWVKSLIPSFVVAGLTIEAFRFFHQARRSEVFGLDALEVSLQKVFGDSLLTTLLTTELAVWYYAFAGWLVRWRGNNTGSIPFSYHRKTLYPLMLVALLPLALLETIVLHLIIQSWNPTAAWIMTALNIYTLIWLSADFNALRLNPVLLDVHWLHLRIGLRWHVKIALSDIGEIRAVTSTDKDADAYLGLAIATDVHLVICLKEPVIVMGLFGRQKLVSRIGIALDDEKLFLAEMGKSVAKHPPADLPAKF